jgi:hypothetical protein
MDHADPEPEADDGACACDEFVEQDMTQIDTGYD